MTFHNISTFGRGTINLDFNPRSLHFFIMGFFKCMQVKVYNQVYLLERFYYFLLEYLNKE